MQIQWPVGTELPELSPSRQQEWLRLYDAIARGENPQGDSEDLNIVRLVLSRLARSINDGATA